MTRLVVALAFLMTSLDVLAGTITTPIGFEQNDGQWPADVLFAARSVTGAVILMRESVRLQTRGGEVMELAFVNPAKSNCVRGETVVSRTNYFVGRDPSGWLRNVPVYERVRYSDLRNGIDVEFYGRDGTVEFDVSLAGGVDPANFALRAVGTESLSISDGGDLVMTTSRGETRLRAPVSWQQTSRGRRPVDVRYEIAAGGVIRLRATQIDPRSATVVDPVIEFATYFGGRDAEYEPALARDAAGNLYVSGYTYSTLLPGSLPQSSTSRINSFISKIAPDGRSVLWTTWVGGSRDDRISSIVLLPDGRILFVGSTDSDNLPLVKPLQPRLKIGPTTQVDAMIGILRADGSGFDFLTYLGGSVVDYATSAAIDRDGNFLISGGTNSADFPLTAPLLPMEGERSGWIIKLPSDASRITASTFFGSVAEISEIALRSDGSVYASGLASPGRTIPTVNALQPNPAGEGDLFLAKFDAALSTLLFSTYFGGTGSDSPSGLAITSDTIVFGVSTASADLPTVNALQPELRGSRDAYIGQLATDGSRLVAGTYFGGGGDEFLADIDVGTDQTVYAVGITDSTDLPVRDAVNSTKNGDERDVFVVALGADNQLRFATYFGGTRTEEAHTILAGPGDSVTFSGRTFSENLPVANAIQTTFGGTVVDLFLARMTISTTPAVTIPTGRRRLRR